MPASLIKSLRGIGLSISEAVVLGTLLKGGPLFASRAAKETRLNRTTTYGVLKELVEKGLVSKVKERGATSYQAISPELLPDYIAKRRADLEEREKELRDAIPQILLMRSKAHVLPKVQFFDGVEGVKQAYEDTLRNNPSKRIYGFTGTEAILSAESVDMEWINAYIRRRASLGITYRTVAMEGASSRAIKARDEAELRLTKLFPPGYSFEIEMNIYENKVLIASFSRDNPLAVIIQDEKITELMRALFGYIDSTLPA